MMSVPRVVSRKTQGIIARPGGSRAGLPHRRDGYRGCAVPGPLDGRLDPLPSACSHRLPAGGESRFSSSNSAGSVCGSRPFEYLESPKRLFEKHERPLESHERLCEAMRPTCSITSTHRKAHSSHVPTLTGRVRRRSSINFAISQQMMLTMRSVAGVSRMSSLRRPASADQRGSTRSTHACPERSTGRLPVFRRHGIRRLDV